MLFELYLEFRIEEKNRKDNRIMICEEVRKSKQRI